MNRLYQLKETLPHNLKVIGSFDGVELCLVNFNSQDGLNEYIAENFMHYIESGKLNYFHTKLPQYFHCSIAKNLAHRLGLGGIMYNLDGDNFITENNVEKILGAFDARKGIFLHERIKKLRNGTCGRIALRREDFYLLGGYDEKLLGVSWQDMDLVYRLSRLSLQALTAQSEIKPAILNTKRETMANQKKQFPFLVYDCINFLLVCWRNILKKKVQK